MKELDEIRQMDWVIDFRIGIVKSEPPDPITAMRKAQSDGKLHYWYWYAEVRGQKYAEQIEIPNSNPQPVNLHEGGIFKPPPVDTFRFAVLRAADCLRRAKPS